MEDPIFKQFPLTDKRTISVGSVPVPYHIYDGHGMLIVGTVPQTAVKPLIESENLELMHTVNGQALMAIWVCDFNEASLGPHNELQVAFAVSHKATSPVSDHPLGLLKAMSLNPDTRLLCHGLWNSSKQVVAYNRELLGLPARINEADFEYQQDRKTFNFRNEHRQSILQGEIAVAPRSSFKVVWDMIRLFGLLRSMRLSANGVFPAIVVNPVSARAPQNLDAQAFLSSDTPIVQYGEAVQSLTWGIEPYRSLDFKPLFVEHFAPFHFVYLMPKIEVSR